MLGAEAMNGNSGNATATQKTGLVAVDFYWFTCRDNIKGNSGNAKNSAINATRAHARDERGL